MNEQNWEEQFSREVDRMLAGGSPSLSDDAPAEAKAALEMAARLTAADLSAGTEPLREDIRRRIATSRHTRKGWSSRQGDNPMNHQSTLTRKLALSGATLMLVLAASLALPPVRTFAEGILRQIGGVTLTDDPTAMERMDGQPAEVSDPNDPLPTAAPPRLLSAGEASAIAGYPVYAAGALPEGYELVFRDAAVQDNGVTTVRTHYYDQPAGQFSGFVILSQDTYPADAEGPLGEWAVSDAPISDVTVRGVPGLWVEGAPIMGQVDLQGNVQTQGLNILIWEEEGYTFSLLTNALSLDEMQVIAGSLSE